MTFERLFLIVACIAPACNRETTGPIPVSNLVAQDGLDTASRAPLAEPAFQDLAFVPADIDLLARVDLAAMVAAQPEAVGKLDFILHAQQPAVWELLAGAGAGLGQEIGSLYLVVRGEEILVAATGALDADKLNAALAPKSGRAGTTVAQGTLYEWPSAPKRAVGGHDPGDERIGPIAIGVDEGLLLVGAPELVKRALEVRAGQGRDVRRSPLAREIAPTPPNAMAWAALRADRDASLGALAPGLRSARLHARPPAVEVRAEFASADQARAFEGRLGTLLQLGAKLAGGSPIGETLERLRSAKISVEGQVVSVSATI